MTTPSERLAAARHKRSLIAQQLKNVKTNRLLLTNVLGNPQSVLGRCRLDTVLLHAPGFAKAGVHKFFREMPKKYRIEPYTEVGTLTKADVEVIMRRLPARVRMRQLSDHARNEQYKQDENQNEDDSA